MKTFEEDKELRQLLKGVPLEKPAPDFTKHVMNRVFQERSMLEQVKAEPILGRGFWIIMALFLILMVAMILLSGNSPVADSNSFLPEVNSQEFMSGYRSFFERLGNLPASVAGISVAFALLIFLDRFISSKKPQVV